MSKTQNVDMSCWRSKTCLVLVARIVLVDQLHTLTIETMTGGSMRSIMGCRCSSGTSGWRFHRHHSENTPVLEGFLPRLPHAPPSNLHNRKSSSHTKKYPISPWGLPPAPCHSRDSSCPQLLLTRLAYTTARAERDSLSRLSNILLSLSALYLRAGGRCLPQCWLPWQL